MLSINPKIYLLLSEKLIDEIGSESYYSGEVTINEPEIDYHLSATLMIYFASEHYPEGYETFIQNIVPIWWELHTTTDQGEELNDFDFNILKQYICS